MALQYKNVGFSLATTDVTNILTVDSQSRAIVKGLTIANEHNNNVDIHLYFHDSSDSNTSHVVYHKQVSSDTTVYPLNNEPLNLEEGDSLKIKADNAGTCAGILSYALLNRSDENG